MFLGLIRAKEAELYQRFPLKKPVLDVGVGDGFFAKITFSQTYTNKCHPDVHRDPLAVTGLSRRSGPPPQRGPVQRREIPPLAVTSSKTPRNDSFQIDVGLDLKNSRMGEAEKLGVYKKLVTFDGIKIPFPDNSFNTVVSNCVLEHVENLDGLLYEIRRVLKPGGLFLTTVVSDNWEKYLLGGLFFGDRYRTWMRKKQVHLNMLSEREWKKSFSKAGMKIDQEIGYLDRKAVRLIDLSHYLSAGSLVSYKLLNKWVIWKGKPQFFLSLLSKLISPDLPPDNSGNLFFSLQK